jgi:hypothetical protein
MARMQLDTIVGMGFSNIIALFIMLTSARPNQDAVLERSDQRGSRGANHGHDYADRLAPPGDGPVHPDAVGSRAR